MTQAERNQMLRQGPRPLPLHLLAATLAWQSSRLAWPLLKLDWPASSPLADPRFAALRQALAELQGNPDPRLLDAEIASRASRFLDGLAAYRHHPYRRTLEDPPPLWQEGTTKLLDYAPGDGIPLLLVPSLVNRAQILDLMPDKSFVRWLAGEGFRPFLLDWDAPGEAEKRFTLTDYVCGRLEAALDQVLAASAGRPPLVLGYCMGGLLALALALRRQREVAGLVLLATPWDFHAGGQAAAARRLASLLVPLAPAIEFMGALPVDAIQALFAALDPLLALKKFLAFGRLDPSSPKADAFVALEDWLNEGVPLAAPVARETLAGWYGDNTPARGAWRIAGRVVQPADWRKPALVLVPEADRIVPPASALALGQALPDAKLLSPPLGHIGMMVSAGAKAQVWEVVKDWGRGVGERVGPSPRPSPRFAGRGRTARSVP